MARDYAALPYEYLEEMEELGDAEFGRLCRALLEYSMTGTPIALNGNERFYARRVMRREDYYRKSYEERAKTNRANGNKGGRPRKTAAPDDKPVERVETQENPEKPSATEKTQEENKNENKNDFSSAAASAHTHARAQGAFAYYQDKIGYDMSREAMGLLPKYIQDMGDEVVMAAIDEALDNGVPRWSYVKSILQNWTQAKVRDMDSLNRLRDSRKRTKSARRGRNGPQPAAPLTPEQEAKQARELEENQRELQQLLASVGGAP